MTPAERRHMGEVYDRERDEAAALDLAYDRTARAVPRRDDTAIVHGEHGAGPLTVYADNETSQHVHVGWPEGGMYLAAGNARALARMLDQAAGRVAAAEWVEA